MKKTFFSLSWQNFLFHPKKIFEKGVKIQTQKQNWMRKINEKWRTTIFNNYWKIINKKRTLFKNQRFLSFLCEFELCKKYVALAKVHWKFCFSEIKEIFIKWLLDGIKSSINLTSLVHVIYDCPSLHFIFLVRSWKSFSFLQINRIDTISCSMRCTNATFPLSHAISTRCS